MSNWVAMAISADSCCATEETFGPDCGPVRRSVRNRRSSLSARPIGQRVEQIRKGQWALPFQLAGSARHRLARNANGGWPR